VSASSSLDTNIVLRFLLNDHADHSPRAKALFNSIRLGEVEVFCPATVVFEAIHYLHRTLSVPRPAIAQTLAELGSYAGLKLDDGDAIPKALAFWVEQPSLDFADCYHLALTKELGMSQIYTFDKKMNRYPGVERIEP
jgi:predicted nucleic acid-binding protein